MNSHPAEACRHGDRLMRDDPDFSGETVHFHGKSHGRVDGPNSLLLQSRNDAAGNLIHVVTTVVKFQIRHRAGGAPDGFPIHAADKADQRLGVRKVTDDIVLLIGNLYALDLDEADVVGTGFPAYLAEPGRVEGLQSDLHRLAGCLLLKEP